MTQLLRRFYYTKLNTNNQAIIRTRTRTTMAERTTDNHLDRSVTPIDLLSVKNVFKKHYNKFHFIMSFFLQYSLCSYPSSQNVEK